MHRRASPRAAALLTVGLLAALASLFAARPAAAADDDTLARRARACTGCHGQQGRAAPDGYYPRLAGKPAAYLFDQLLAFRDGRRQYALMTHLLEPLSDDYLRDLAAYFAALKLPYEPPLPLPPDLAADAAAQARARRLLTQGDAARQLPACSACHGAELTGALPGVPALLGLPRDYLNAQLGAWRTGTRAARAPDCMADVARRLAPDEVALLAAWLAAQPVPTTGSAAAPVAALPQPMPLRCGTTVAVAP
ncbi:MAG: c-type cytochrome [Proteobacteria bacterium]|nr:c-type cytochrome [Pseudomonadota bacterium]